MEGFPSTLIIHVKVEKLDYFFDYENYLLKRSLSWVNGRIVNLEGVQDAEKKISPSSTNIQGDVLECNHYAAGAKDGQAPYANGKGRAN